MAVEAQHHLSNFTKRLVSTMPNHHLQFLLPRSCVPDQSPLKRPLQVLDLEAVAAEQREELSQMLRFHAHQMRCELAEMRRMQMQSLMEVASEVLSCRLTEKEREIERARRCNAELEARAAQLRAESHIWQARARAQEAAAATLQAQLHQALMSCKKDEGGIDTPAEDEASAFVDPDRVPCSATRTMAHVCRACHVAMARVIILPCGHLCLCFDCGASAYTCPVCFQFRHSSVEISLW